MSYKHRKIHDNLRTARIARMEMGREGIIKEHQVPEQERQGTGPGVEVQRVKDKERGELDNLVVEGEGEL